MKSLIVTLAMMVSTAALANSQPIFETRSDRKIDVTADYGFNKKLGRAWAEVTVAEYNGDSSDYTDERILIPGMSLDLATKEIIVERDGERIVCGQLYNRRWVIDQGSSVRETGRCRFEVKKIVKLVDNGFEIRKVPTAQVFFIVE